MGEQFPCPFCGHTLEKPDDAITSLVICPQCGSTVSVPNTASPAAVPPETGAPSGDQAPVYYSQPPPAMVPTYYDENALGRIRLVGIFNIVFGSLALLGGLFFLGYTIFLAVAPEAIVSEALRGSPELTRGIMLGIYGGAAGISLVVGGLILAGGIKLLRRGPGAYGWGMTAAILSLVSIWNCCLYPLGLFSGIYTLVVLSNPDTRRVLDQGQ